MIHLILGHFLNEFLLRDNPTYKKLLLLKNGSVEEKNSSGKLLKCLVDSAIRNHDLPQRGPYSFEEIVPKLADFYKSQVHLIEGVQEKKVVVTSFPEKFDDSLPQIYLLTTVGKHVILIHNKKTFVRNNRSFCFECRKTYSKMYRHPCKNRERCINCRCFFASENTILAKNTDLQFCDTKIETNIKIKCDKCELTCDTQKCFKLHLSLCGLTGNGRRGWKCEKCDKFFAAGNKTSKQLKDEHICHSTKYCSYCFTTHSEENHFCKVIKEKPNQIWPNLVFYGFQYMDKSSSNCNDCFNIRNNFAVTNGLNFKELLLHSDFQSLLCSDHLSNVGSAEANICYILKEFERGKFEQHILCDDNLISNLNSLGNHCVLNFPYFTAGDNVIKHFTLEIYVVVKKIMLI